VRRIAIASDDGKTIAAHTGRCACLVVFEVAGGAARWVECRPNTFTDHARGQCTGDPHAARAPAHHSHAPLVNALADCCALVTRGLGRRLVDDLARVGIEVVVTSATRVEDAAADFAAGRLNRIDGTGCCRHAGD